MKAEAGEEYDYDLKVFNRPNKHQVVKQRRVEVFSSDPSLIYAPPKEDRAEDYGVLKGADRGAQNIPVCICKDEEGAARSKVNCVDINTQEIIEQFLVEVKAVAAASEPEDSSEESEGEDDEEELEEEPNNKVAGAPAVPPKSSGQAVKEKEDKIRGAMAAHFAAGPAKGPAKEGA